MQQLHQAIEQQNSFMAGLFLAEQFQSEVDISSHILQVEEFIRGACNAVNQADDAEEKLQQLVQYFYTELAFSGDENQIFPPNYNFLDKVVDYRTGIPISLSILLCKIGNSVGLRMSEVAFPGHYLVRVEMGEDRYWFIDPLDGSRLEWGQLLTLYRKMSEEDAENVPNEVLQPCPCGETVVRLLHNMKGAYIDDGQLQEALSCSELLLELSPDDPYERRDRGFLLHQLDCPQLALADYHYFIKHCPTDPISELLKIHMNTLQASDIILH